MLATIVGLAAAATGALTLAARPHPRAEEPVRDFHRLVGGLGFGPAADLERCEFAFDPRLCAACSADEGPICGGLFFCPYHASNVLEYRPLK